MKRRDFIASVGAAVAAGSVGIKAQQPIPVIGFLSASSTGINDRLRGFHKGLAETGFVEGQNVIIEYRSPQIALGRGS